MAFSASICLSAAYKPAADAAQAQVFYHLLADFLFVHFLFTVRSSRLTCDWSRSICFSFSCTI
jgi:hypothetical protein